MKKHPAAPKRHATVPVYRRPSGRGGNGSKRELVVTSVARLRLTRRPYEQRVPYIRMSGLWLQRLGFQRGDRIEITEEHERLVLVVIHEDRDLPIN